MAAKNNNALFYTCSLIEYIGRTKKETRCKIVEDLGKDTIKRIYFKGRRSRGLIF